MKPALAGASTSGRHPLSPRRRWRAVIIATITFAPACWALITGLVILASDDGSTEAGAAAVVFGLAVIPFVFVVLAFASDVVGAPGAVIKAMLASLPVGIVISGVAADAVTGIVAGVGVGAVLALRADEDVSYRNRLIAVVVAAGYSFVAVRSVPALLLPIAPVLPITAVALADHYTLRHLAP